MKNSDYWKKRFEQLEDERYSKTEDYYKDLEKQFRMAQNSVQADIEKWYWRLADNNDISYAATKKLLKKDELEEFHWTLEEYIKYGQENAIDQRWMKQLENASAKVHISRLEAIKIQIQQHAEKLFLEYEGKTTEFLRDVYAEGFYHTAYEIAKGTGIGSNLAKLNIDAIDTVIKKPWAQDGSNFSDRIWNNKKKLLNKLHTELAQNVIRGESPDKAAKRIAEEMGVSARQARTLLYTESAAIASKTQQDCFDELDLERYEILATLDSRTSDICREMDKKVFEMKDYQVGVTAPPFHPRCRSCTCPYFDDEFTFIEQRTARSEETGKVYYVPANMNYAEWKEIFVDGGTKDGLLRVPNIQDKKIRNAYYDFNSILANSNGDSTMITRMIMASDTTEFELKEEMNHPFAYDPKKNCIVYNPNAENYELYDMNFVMCHELAHKIDIKELHSWKNKRFTDAFDKLADKIIKDRDFEKQVADAFAEGGLYCDDAALSDIIGALTKGKWNKYLPIAHEEEYWNENDTFVYLETFANITSIDILELDSKIEFEGMLKELFEAYKEVAKWEK